VQFPETKFSAAEDDPNIAGWFSGSPSSTTTSSSMGASDTVDRTADMIRCASRRGSPRPGVRDPGLLARLPYTNLTESVLSSGGQI
jgi:hypothetical protein